MAARGQALVLALKLAVRVTLVRTENVIVIFAGAKLAHAVAAILVLRLPICNETRIGGESFRPLRLPFWFRNITLAIMTQSFTPGDDLVFQLESGLGLLRVIAVEGEGAQTVWHLLAYDEFFPDVESAERALAGPDPLEIRNAHMALTDRAFERTPAARLGNRPVHEEELGGYREWLLSERKVSDRSALLLLGIR